MKRKPKIAIVRGASLTDWELQSYLPLTKRYKITIFGAWINEYPFTLPLKVKKLLCLGNILTFIPGGINFLYRTFGDPQVLVGLEKALTGYDIVHTAERTSYYTLQAVRAKKQGRVKKVIVHCWENLLHSKEELHVQKAMKQEVDADTDLFLGGTKGAREVLIKEGIPQKKISLVPFGIDTTHFVPPKQNSSKDITVLFAARMTKGKGVYVLFEAAKEIIKKRKQKDISVMFMGEGEEKNTLKELVKREKLDRWIHITDFVPYRQLREMYWRSEMLVLPSIGDSHWIEQFGLVLTEAMACGTTVIGARRGSIPEIIGNAGMVYSPHSSYELASVILRLHKDSKLRANFSVKGRKRVVSYFSSAIVSHKLNQLYTRILS